MKQLIITAVLIVLGVYLANTFILGEGDGNSGTMKTEGKRIAEIMIDDLGKIESITD